MLRQLPIRVRLTLPFALAMALVLGAVGVAVYLRVGSALLGAVDEGLSSQAAEARSRLADDEEPLLDRDAIDNASLAQVLAADGRVLRSSNGDRTALIAARARRLALAGRTVRISGPVARRTGEWRLLAVPAGGGTVLVVGRPLTSRDQTLEQLRHDFLLAAPAALLLATLAGYLLAGAALRPVDEMRLQAEAIGAATPDRRLPVPPADDEVSRLARTLNDMLDRLEAALLHERRFVSDASHELRTPLSLLRTELELALRRTRSHAELEAAVRSAAEETERLTKLAEDLLTIARSDQGSLPVHRRPLQARALLVAVAGRFEARAAELGREVVVEPGEEVSLDADPERLEQALGNLVDNALTHGSGTVSLLVRTLPDGAELHVTDEGPGFPDGFAGRAFDRFSRADEARGRGGAGLGLAIAQSIAATHGGSAGVANREAGGADVWLRLAGAQPPPDRA